MPVKPKPGTVVDVVIKGVRFEHEHIEGPVTIRDEEGYCYTMPPQAAIATAGETAPGDQVTSLLSLLDGMEAEGCIPAYVGVAVRKKLGIPPRHWPPQTGDVWDDGFPWGTSLWFAKHFDAGDHGQRDLIMMICAEGGQNNKHPHELLESAAELTLVYRKDGSR